MKSHTQPIVSPKCINNYSNLKHFFTLVELLVVISIIAILASILLPSLKKAKDTAITSRCANNLRQIGINVQSYTLDYDGLLPPGYHDNDYYWLKIYAVEFNKLSWNDVWKWNQNGPGIMACPTVELSTEYTNYTLNKAFSYKQRNIKLLSVKSPAQVIYHYETVPNTTNTYCTAVDWYRNFGYTYGDLQFRHGKQSNFLMTDGHICKLGNLNDMNWVWSGFKW